MPGGIQGNATKKAAVIMGGDRQRTETFDGLYL